MRHIPWAYQRWWDHLTLHFSWNPFQGALKVLVSHPALDLLQFWSGFHNYFIAEDVSVFIKMLAKSSQYPMTLGGLQDLHLGQ